MFGKRLLTLLAAGLLLLSAAGCKKDTPAGKAFTFQLESDPRQLDPQVSTDRSSVTMAAALFGRKRQSRARRRRLDRILRWLGIHLYPAGFPMEYPKIQGSR